MAKYTELVENILKNIGGKENIVSVTHCVTRLRFNLKDESIANDDVLKNMTGVITVMKTSGQYQVVIGNHVPDVYAEVLKQAGINGDEEVTAGGKKMSIKDKALDIISGVMMPSIMVLCASGMIKGFLALAVVAGLITSESSWYLLFNAVGDAMFYFFPIILGYNSALKFKVNPYIGLIIGAALCYPTINGVEMNFFGLTLHPTYTGSVLPVIFIVGLAAPLERFLKKVIPDVIKAFMVPAIVMLIMIPIGYIVIGPIANLISAMLALVINTIFGFSPLLAGLLLGFFWQFIVIMGVHMVIVLPSMMNLIAGNPDPILPLVIASTFAQTGMVFAVWLKTKDANLKQIAFPAFISGIFGVTEPAIYGVTLPRFKLFIMTCVASGIASAFQAVMGVKTYTMAGMGIFGFPGYIDPSGVDTGSLLWAVVGIAGATVMGAIFGFIMFKDDEFVEVSEQDDELVRQTESIISPISGIAKPLNTIEDVAFAEGLLGQGIAIDPKDGNVYAPFDGTIVTLFPTKHAIGLVSDTGCEILIHVGMDTVKLNGEHFESFVEQGAKVKKGEKLVSFAIDKIKEAGYSTVTPIIVTNTNDYLDVVPVAENEVNSSDEILKVMV